MVNRLLIVLLSVMLVGLVVSPRLYAQGEISVQGIVKDSQTGDALPGANVILVGTSMGASTNISGQYTIRNVPAGSYQLRATYVGYKSETVPVEIKEGQTISHDFSLVAISIQGETVVVTAQALGQNQAINQQLAAPSIVNVVSSARIQELPDANAAESVGRLPGVSVLRSGGEGYKVVIRGLSPQYNAIMVDGVRMTSTDPNNRSVDLSMISPNILEGIEVMKAITPDQDADALGGSVNFKMREATFGKEGLGFDLLAQGGYNKLKNTYNDFKLVGSVNGRFLDQRLGVFAQADIERRNRSDDVLGASYYVNNPKLGQYNQPLISAVNLTESSIDRKRAGGTLVLDYVLPEGKINFTNFFSLGTTPEQDRSEGFNVGADHSYTVTDANSKLNVMTNILSLEQSLGFLKMDAVLSNSWSENKSPSTMTVVFDEVSSGLNNADPRLPPSAIQAYAKNNLSLTDLNTMALSNSTSEDRNYTAALNFHFDYNFSDQITSTIKFGGKYRHKIRYYNYDVSNGALYLGSGSNTRAAILNAYPWMKATVPDPSSNLPLSLFVDPNYKYSTFFGGEYKLGAPMNIPLLWDVLKIVEANGTLESWYPHNYSSNVSDYSGTENGTAAYVMATVNLGPEITFIPGVRYEKLATSYTAPRGTYTPLVRYDWPHHDTTMDKSHDYVLPMVHLRYKPFSWFDVRFAYTQTLTYPDYVSITPLIDIGLTSVNWHNANLKAAESQNFDLYASVYSNDVGLFTVGAFTKSIDDLIFQAVNRVILDPSLYEGLGAGQKNFFLTTYINNPNRVHVWGIEFDWQTHFWYLPEPFTGLVLNVNYTHIYSEAKYPQTIINTVYVPKFVKTIVDTFYTDRLVNQPNNIVNMSLGYDYKGFSTRVSVLYTADIFSTPNFWPDLDQNTAEYLRWDLSVKQDLPWFGLQAFFDLNNINARHDLVLVAGSKFPSAEHDYGLTADVGLRWRL
jgi:TonB-dependent receptor